MTLQEMAERLKKEFPKKNVSVDLSAETSYFPAFGTNWLPEKYTLKTEIRIYEKTVGSIDALDFEDAITRLHLALEGQGADEQIEFQKEKSNG